MAQGSYDLNITSAMLNSLVTGQSTIRVKVFNELITKVIKNRKQRGHYCTKRSEGYYTNRVIKPLCTYFLLKALTPSGVIRDYTKIPLLDYLKVSKATFYSHLKQLESLKLVKRTGDSLRLTSYDRMAEMFDLVPQSSNITYITYNCTVKFHYLVYGSILHNSQKEIKRVVENKIKCNPELVDHYKRVLSVTTSATEFQKALLQKQISDFKTKQPEDLRENFETELINADLQITARNIRKRFGFKSYKSVAFLKSMLKRLRIAEINKRSIVSAHRCRKPRQYVEYNRETKVTTWRLPDEIVFKGGLFA
jgi:hypothetical protein